MISMFVLSKTFVLFVTTTEANTNPGRQMTDLQADALDID